MVGRLRAGAAAGAARAAAAEAGLTGARRSGAAANFLDALDENEDVQEVYHNAANSGDGEEEAGEAEEP